MTDPSSEVEELFRAMSRVKYAFKQYVLKCIRESDVDITFEMLEILSFLWRSEQVNQQEIANATLKDKASLTYLIDHLTKRGLVERRPDENDRRNKLIFLTEKGRALQLVFRPLFKDFYGAIQKVLSLEKIQEMQQILDELNDNISH